MGSSHHQPHPHQDRPGPHHEPHREGLAEERGPAIGGLTSTRTTKGSALESGVKLRIRTRSSVRARQGTPAESKARLVTRPSRCWPSGRSPERTIRWITPSSDSTTLSASGHASTAVRKVCGRELRFPRTAPPRAGRPHSWPLPGCDHRASCDRSAQRSRIGGRRGGTPPARRRRTGSARARPRPENASKTSRSSSASSSSLTARLARSIAFFSTPRSRVTCSGTGGVPFHARTHARPCPVPFPRRGPGTTLVSGTPAPPGS